MLGLATLGIVGYDYRQLTTLIPLASLEGAGEVMHVGGAIAFRTVVRIVEVQLVRHCPSRSCSFHGQRVERPTRILQIGCLISASLSRACCPSLRCG